MANHRLESPAQVADTASVTSFSPAGTGTAPAPAEVSAAPTSYRDEAEAPSRPEPPPVASLRAVGKHFGSVRALHELEIEIGHGRITVLLGPNGAGKTTAIRLITGALRPDEGQVTVFDTDPSGPDGELVRRRCGVVSAKPSLYDRLSGRDNLGYAAELYGIGRGSEAGQRIEEAAAWFGIEQALDQLVGGYSTGMKTRLALARSILHQPDLLLLDEPTSGLDPESARSVLELVRAMTTQGRSVLLCTHLLAEAEGLADEVVVVQDGTTVVRGRPADLARPHWPNPEATISYGSGPGLDELTAHPQILRATPEGPAIRLVLAEGPALPTVVSWLVARRAEIRSVVPWEPTLEDLYFAIRREHGLDGTGNGSGA